MYGNSYNCLCPKHLTHYFPTCSVVMSKYTVPTAIHPDLCSPAEIQGALEFFIDSIHKCHYNSATRQIKM